MGFVMVCQECADLFGEYHKVFISSAGHIGKLILDVFLGKFKKIMEYFHIYKSFSCYFILLLNILILNTQNIFKLFHFLLRWNDTKNNIEHFIVF